MAEHCSSSYPTVKKGCVLSISLFCLFFLLVVLHLTHSTCSRVPNTISTHYPQRTTCHFINTPRYNSFSIIFSPTHLHTTIFSEHTQFSPGNFSFAYLITHRFTTPIRFNVLKESSSSVEYFSCSIILRTTVFRTPNFVFSHYCPQPPVSFVMINPF